jgi:hypothetical protein
MNNKSTALLFLTYDNIQHAEAFRPYFAKTNVYIHPKNKQKVVPYLRPYIIDELVPTQWGAYSIVEATLSLLRAAFTNSANQWFVLLSQDCFPVYGIDSFQSWLSSQQKSMFNLITKGPVTPTGVGGTLTEQRRFWKTSQWWILNRADVNHILQNCTQFTQQHNGFTKKLVWAAIDEIYFLSLLMTTVLNYQFNNQQTMYDKWLSATITKSPATISRLLPEDWSAIKLANSWFIRKTLPSFIKTLKTSFANELWVIHIGTETKQMASIPDVDVVIFASVPIDTINKQLLRKTIQIFPVLWNFFYESIANIVASFPIHHWDTIRFIDERFSFTEPHNNTNNVSLSQLKSRPTFNGNAYMVQPILDKPLFTVSTDAKRNRMLSMQPTESRVNQIQPKIAFLFLTMDDVNFPQLWTPYINKAVSEGKASVYCHPKNPDSVSVPWLRNAIIGNLVSTGWGFIVEALVSLLREAMKDPLNMKFIVVSESCIPLLPFDEFYKFCFQSGHDFRTSFIKSMRILQYDWNDRIKNQQGWKTMGSFSKHYSRWCLSRYHVQQLLVDSHPDELQFFYRMFVGDEFWLTLLRNQQQQYVLDFEVTFDNWDRIKQQQKVINEEIKALYENIEKNGENPAISEHIARLKDEKYRMAANPYSYVNVTQNDIVEALEKRAFFWRKFPKQSNLLELQLIVSRK